MVEPEKEKGSGRKSPGDDDKDAKRHTANNAAGEKEKGKDRRRPSGSQSDSEKPKSSSPQPGPSAQRITRRRAPVSPISGSPPSSPRRPRASEIQRDLESGGFLRASTPEPGFSDWNPGVGQPHVPSSSNGWNSGASRWGPTQHQPHAPGFSGWNTGVGQQHVPSSSNGWNGGASRWGPTPQQQHAPGFSGWNPGVGQQHVPSSSNGLRGGATQQQQQQHAPSPHHPPAPHPAGYSPGGRRSMSPQPGLSAWGGAEGPINPLSPLQVEIPEEENLLNLTGSASAAWRSPLSPRVSPVDYMAVGSAGSPCGASHGSAPISPLILPGEGLLSQEVIYRPADRGGFHKTYTENGPDGYRRFSYHVASIDPWLTELKLDDGGPPLDYFGVRFTRSPSGHYEGVYFQRGINGLMERGIFSEEQTEPMDLSPHPSPKDKKRDPA